MKGCPFNNFGPCREDECVFFLPYGDDQICIIHSQYFLAFQNGGNLCDLIAVLATSLLLEPSAFESSSEYQTHLLKLRDDVDLLLEKLRNFQKLLKDVKS